jgi:hypothetical protein
LHELWRCSGTDFHADVVAALATAVSDEAALVPVERRAEVVSA